MARIAIVGGGFGGINTALELHRRGHDDLVLFDPRSRFVFTPLLHEVAGGVFTHESVTVEFARLVPTLRHVQEHVDKIDLDKKLLHAGGRTHRFDYVVLAPGACTTPPWLGVFALNSYQDAYHIRCCIDRNLRKAQALRAEDPKADIAALLSVVIIGGGYTGVEVAGECADLARYCAKGGTVRPRVTLVHSRDLLLGDAYFHKVAKETFERKGIRVILRTRVQDVKDGVVITPHERIPAGCVIWAGGITPNRILPLDAPIPVRDTLQVEGYNFAFGVGDGAIVASTPFPALAQVASMQGMHVAKTIDRLLRGKLPEPFRHVDRGRIISLGQRRAVGRVLGVRVRGFPAWFLMRTIYLTKFRDLRQTLRTMYMYTVRLFTRR